MKKFYYVVAILSTTLLGSVLVSDQASATFFAAKGDTKVYGIDRRTGQTYTAANPADRIYIWPGDTQQVGWRATVWNAGDIGNRAPGIPFLSPGIDGTDITVKNRYFDGSTSNGGSRPHALVVPKVYYPDEGPAIVALVTAGASGLSYYFGYDWSKKTWYPPTLNLSGFANATTVGRTFCQYGSANPAGYNVIPWPGAHSIGFGTVGNVNFDGHMACAEVTQVYDLQPSITFNNKDSIASGGTASITPVVRPGTLPDGATVATDSLGTHWQVTQVVIAPGGTKPNATGGISSQLACSGNGSAYFKTAQTTCRTVAQSGSSSNRKNTIFRPDGSIRTGTSFPSADNTALPAGSIVCYALSVDAYRPHIQGSVTWRHSALDCSEEAVSRKSPKLQVLGDDVRVGGRIETSQSSAQNDLTKLFGSWGEYASYSVGKTDGFATSSGMKDGVARSAPKSQWSKLTFANTQADYGEFSQSVQSRGATDIKSFFSQGTTQAGASSSVNVSMMTGRKTPYRIDNGSTMLDVEGGTIAKGKTVILVASGSVTIRSDIRYTTDALQSLRDIPQVVIIAENISIAEGVNQVDAWLIANSQNGTINTCSPRQSPAQRLTSSICSNQLRVNGPVVTNKLLLHRTAGSTESNPSEPAEIFSNNGDSYLWALNYSRSPSSMKTTYQTELPPRY